MRGNSVAKGKEKKKKAPSPRNAYFPPFTINEVQTRSCLYLVTGMPPSKPVAYIHCSQRPFVIAVSVSSIPRLLDNQGPSTMRSRRTVESQIVKAILGFLSYQILLLCYFIDSYKFCVQFGAPHHKKDIDVLEWVQPSWFGAEAHDVHREDGRSWFVRSLEEKT